MKKKSDISKIFKVVLDSLSVAFAVALIVLLWTVPGGWRLEKNLVPGELRSAYYFAEVFSSKVFSGEERALCAVAMGSIVLGAVLAIVNLVMTAKSAFGVVKNLFCLSAVLLFTAGYFLFANFIGGAYLCLIPGAFVLLEGAWSLLRKKPDAI